MAKKPDLFPKPKFAPSQKFWKAQETRIKARAEYFRALALGASIEQLKLEAKVAKVTAKRLLVEKDRDGSEKKLAESKAKIAEAQRLDAEHEKAVFHSESLLKLHLTALEQIPPEDVWGKLLSAQLKMMFGASVEQAEKLCKRLASIDFELGETPEGEDGRATKILMLEREKVENDILALKPKF